MIASPTQGMVKADDRLYLPERVGGLLQFGLQKRLLCREQFQVRRFVAVLHQQARTADGGLECCNLFCVDAEAAVGCLPLRHGVVHLRSGVQQRLLEGDECLLPLGFCNLVLRFDGAMVEDRLHE